VVLHVLADLSGDPFKTRPRAHQSVQLLAISREELH